MHVNRLQRVLKHGDLLFKLCSFVCRRGEEGGAAEEKAEAEGGQAHDTLCFGLHTVQHSKPSGERFFTYFSFKVGNNFDINPNP